MAPLGGKAVLFGGSRTADNFGFYGLQDTWEWNGAAWTNRVVAGPPVRADAWMVLFGSNVILAGGDSPGGTWSWNGTAWKVVTPEPFGSYDGSLAVLGGKAVQFGGYFGGQATDLQRVWDGAVSTIVMPTPRPSARYNAAMATLGTKIVLFGGSTGFQQDFQGVLAETWEWDGSTWTQRNVAGPSARSGAAIATFGNKVVLFGGGRGNGDTGLADTWEWDGNAWTQRVVVGPSARQGAVMSSR
jgi:hypothetical protein